MKKVLIVDDEVLVRMGFRSIIDWESCGFTVVGDAADGEEALAQIRILHPDLVFTDLRMEPVDGFELMKACAAEFPALRFIVLSSYNDFENVRQAMRCGALDYVFKLDVKPEQLRKMLCELTWDAPAAPLVSREEQHAVRGAAFRRAINGTAENAQSERTLTALYPGIRWGAPFRLLTVALDNYELQENASLGRSSAQTIAEVENIVNEVLGKETDCCSFEPDKTHLLWQGKGAGSLQSLQSAYGKAEDYIKRYLARSTTAVISEDIASLKYLPEAYRQNIETLSYRYLLDHGRIHGYHVLTADTLRAPIDLSALENALYARNWEKVETLCMAAFSQMGKQRGVPLRKLRVHLLDMLFTIKRVCPAISEWTDASEHTLEYLIQCFDRLGMLREAFEQALKACLPADAKKTYRLEIALILAYVQEHPKEEISVSKAAQLTQLSESYFSHVFKREMGMSFIDWLNRERVERALALLSQTDLRINEVAAQVGIENANYFSILFKKLTGKTPVEAREKAKNRIVISAVKSE